MIVYLAQDIPAFEMYCINGESGSSLLIESTDSLIYVIGSEKTIFMAQNKKNVYFYVGLKLQVCYLFCSLFQVHSAFHCVVMGANAKRCSQT